MPPFNPPDLFAPLRRMRCLLKPAFGIYAAVLAAFVALGAYVLYDSYERQNDAALATAGNLTRVIAERLDATFERIDNDLKVFIEFLPSDAMQAAHAARYRKRFEAEFRTKLAQFPEISSRNVVAANGNSLYRVGAPSPINNFGDRDWFVALRDNPQLDLVISDVITARASGKPTIVIARAIRDRDRHFLGTANATLNLYALGTKLESLNVGHSGLIIVRKTGINKLILRHPADPASFNTTANTQAHARIAAGEKSGALMTLSPLDQITRATAFQVLDHFPISISVGIAKRDYLKDWYRVAIYSCLAAFALIIVLSAFVVNRVRNETRLSVLARQLSAGRVALKANEQFLRDVIESASDGILVEDTRGQVRAFNRRFQSMWKLPPDVTATAARDVIELHMGSRLVNPKTLPLTAVLPDSAEVLRLRTIELNDGRRLETFVSQLLHDGRSEGRVWSFHDVTESKRTLRLYRSIIESSADAFVAFDDRLHITAWSTRAEKIFDIPEERALGKLLTETIIPDAADAAGAVCRALIAIQTGNAASLRPVQRVTARHRNGREFPAEIQISGYRMGERWQYTSFLRDISTRLREEEQVAQAQKFEAIGQLTGGLAHDFNNLLGIIIGSLDLIGEDFTGDRELFDAATSAAQRGAEVTRSLLAVARRQKLSPRDVNIDALLLELAPLLRHTAGKGIEVEIRALADGAIVNIDAGGFNNALINLVINARDAMPGGGRLTISAAVPDAAADAAGHETRCVLIRVEDDGCGMAPDVALRAFDPFFTTKTRGKGTGLGLAMVYGFARQSGGTVTLSSRPDAGTAVELHLPLRQAAATAAVVHALPAAMQPQAVNHERVLLVDDEPDLLRVTRQWLSSLGYEVVAETRAQRAAALLETSHFDALVSDVVMPGGIDGFKLAEHATRCQPQIAVVLVSGFADDLSGCNTEKYQLLDKPFGKSQLQQTLRTVIAQAQADHDGRQAAA